MRQALSVAVLLILLSGSTCEPRPEPEPCVLWDKYCDGKDIYICGKDGKYSVLIDCVTDYGDGEMRAH